MTQPMPTGDAIALTLALVAGGVAAFYGLVDLRLSASNWLWRRRQRKARP